MVRFTLILLLAVKFLDSTAQTTIKQLDTIHLRGRVLDEMGNPVPYVPLYFRSPSLVYSNKQNYTATNISGEFLLKGAALNDTISIVHPNYSGPAFMNNGARYMTIRMPFLRSSEIGLTIINAKRTVKKQIPSFETLFEPISMHGEYGFLKPVFPGGPDSLQRYIYKRLTYPKKAIQNNIEGIVLIGFTIGIKGKAENAEIINGLGYGCDEIALAIINGMPSWQPAILNAHIIPVKTTVSIKFTLTD